MNTRQAPDLRVAAPSWTSTLQGMFIDHAIQLLLLFGIYERKFIARAGSLALQSWFPRQRSVRTDFSHRIFNLDCKFRQHTIEWAIPFENTVSCLKELHEEFSKYKNSKEGFKPDFPVEIRFSDEDDIYLSPCYKRRTCWIGIVRYIPFGCQTSYRDVFDKFEGIMKAHEGRPHWSKVHSLCPSDIGAIYPCFKDFLEVLQKYDPFGVFQNEYVRRHIYGEALGESAYKIK